MKPSVRLLSSLTTASLFAYPLWAAAPGFVWLEAEDFAEKGDWCVDTQFTHKMGSAYLICPGIDKPTAHPAVATVAVPEAGDWTVWARTKDWLPEFSPGKFALVVNGKESSVLGASRRDGWHWEKVGVFTLAAGDCKVSLKDLSGAYARCDAIVFSRDAAYCPPDEATALEKERARLGGQSLDVAEAGSFDVVVVGAGPGGMGASLGAVRNGAKVALVFDRPVAGGNASTECGIGFDGASLGKQNARESGVVEEIRLTTAYRKSNYTAAFEEMAAKSPALALFRNERVLRVEKDGATMTAVVSRNTLTGKWSRWRGKFFVDSTGDGWLAHFAGARTMYGREAGDEYDEQWIAPKVADKLTMSGKLSWWGGYATKSPVRYETPVWARVMPKGFDRRVTGPGAPWWLETSGKFDDIDDPERARDQMIRIDFGYWGWLKNEWEKRETVANWQIAPPRPFNGRREGMRILGDYVLTANDCREGRLFDDRVSYGGWSLDTHDPLGMDNPHGDGWWHPHSGVPIYSVPYRSLYSTDLSNLFIGSRCQSMTHIALGSMRVQGTQMAAGQAAGTAAALCLRYGTDARGLGRSHIRALQRQLQKDDQYIPNLPNDDPLDLARTAKASASGRSVVMTTSYGRDDRKLRRPDDDAHALSQPRAASFRRGTIERLEGVECLLANGLGLDVSVKATLFGVEAADQAPETGVKLGECTAKVPANKTSLVPFRLAKPIAINCNFVWIVLSKATGVSWLLRDGTIAAGGRAWKGGQWVLVAGQQYSFVTLPNLCDFLDAKPAYVIDGVARPIGPCTHAWVSSPEEPLPQALTLTLEKPADVREVRLTFDSNLTPARVKAMPAELVKGYVVEACVGDTWRKVAEEKENFLRHRVHAFPAVTASAVRVTVTSTWGDPSARIFEIRIY